MNLVFPAAFCVDLASVALFAASGPSRSVAPKVAIDVEALDRAALRGRPPRLKRLRWEHDRRRRGSTQA